MEGLRGEGPVDKTPPAVVEMFPAHNEADVSLDLTEIYVKFNVAMAAAICILTPCGDTGLCYTNASWKDDKTIAIKVMGALKAGYSYQLQLGSDTNKCYLMSAAGIPLPVTSWSFQTMH